MVAGTAAFTSKACLSMAVMDWPMHSSLAAKADVSIESLYLLL